MASDVHTIFDADRVLILTADGVYGGPIAGGLSRRDVTDHLAAGKDPAAVLGNAAATGRSYVARRHVRRIAWVEEVGFLLVSQHWLWDPIRFPFSDRALGRQTFDRLRRELAPDRPALTGKVGMHDLPVDPMLGVGGLFAFLGFAVVICGAVDTLPANARVRGGAVFAALADVGRELGPALSFGVGGVGLLLAVGLLGRWFLRRPTIEYVRVR